MNKLTCEVTPSEQEFFEVNPNPAILIERIGSLHSTLFPLGTIAACDAVTDILLICYTDDTYEYLAPGFDGCILSTSELRGSHAPVLYPNPASSVMFFETASEVQSVRIFDASGRMVRAIQVRNATDGRIDLEGLGHGFYIADIQSLNGVVREKFIVGK